MQPVSLADESAPIVVQAISPGKGKTPFKQLKLHHGGSPYDRAKEPRGRNGIFGNGGRQRRSRFTVVFFGGAGGKFVGTSLKKKTSRG